MARRQTAAPLTLTSVLVLGALLPESALAYCRTTSCSTCERGLDGCVIGGEPAAWPQACVSFSMHHAASEYVDLETATELMQRAFQTWQDVRCPPDGLHPSIDVSHAFGPAMCGTVEYSEGQGNANIIMFRDCDWPYENAGQTLATTSVKVAPNGDIYDADMEINSSLPLTIPDPSAPETKGIVIGADPHDLLAIMTHEAGHFLGLDHTQDQTAIMRVALEPGDDQTTLGADDIAGICAIYPPDRKTPVCDPEPRGGFTPECVSGGLRGGPACTINPTGTGSRLGLWGLFAVGAYLAWQPRRRRGRGA